MYNSRRHTVRRTGIEGIAAKNRHRPVIFEWMIIELRFGAAAGV